MKVYVCVRFNPLDSYIIDHFIKYYKNLGVYKLFVNFNYKLGTDDEFNEFVSNTIKKYEDFIIYNIGPNGINTSEERNILKLRELVEQNADLDNDFIITADSDEFVEFIGYNQIDSVLKMMSIENLDFIKGSTRERIHESGNLVKVVDNIDIFKQFSKFNNFLFTLPKVSIIKSKYYKYTSVGHHCINNIELKGKYGSITHHFRWSIQGFEKTKNWLSIMKDLKYTGWKGIKKYEKIIEIYSKNLLTIKQSDILHE